MKTSLRIGLYLTTVTILNLLSSFLKKTKKIIGKFKDEAAGKPILEFYGIKSKMYSWDTEDKTEKKAKGVKKNVIKREISHSDYRDVLFNNIKMHHQMKTIQSEYV